MGCRSCGVVAVVRGRPEVSAVDVPCRGRPVQLVWAEQTACAADLAGGVVGAWALDLSHDQHNTPARRLDLVPGRSGTPRPRPTRSP